MAKRKALMQYKYELTEVNKLLKSHKHYSKNYKVTYPLDFAINCIDFAISAINRAAYAEFREKSPHDFS